MGTRLAVLALLGALSGAAQATPRDLKDDLKNAVHKLSQVGSYSWSIASRNSGDTSEKYGFGSGEGKVERGGVFWLRTREAPPVEVIVKGPKMAVRLEDGWALERELSAPGAGRRHPNLALVRSLKSRARPSAEAGELLKHAKDLSTGPEGYFTSTLAPEDSKELLHKYLRNTGRTADITSPGGSLAFWVNDGILNRYELRLRGTVTFSAPIPSTWDADEVITVSMTDLGTARVDVPEDVKRLLD